MKNKRHHIIATVILCSLLITLTSPWALAQEGQMNVQSEIVKDCLSSSEHFKFTEGQDYEPFKDLVKPIKGFGDFESQFSDANERYHTFIQCLISSTEQELMGELGIGNQCLEETQLANLTQKITLDELQPVALQAYFSYSTYLRELSHRLRTASFVQPLNRRVAIQNEATQIVNNEIQDAVVALDSAFGMLLELRKAFLMHVQFECMMKHLEDYRRFLGQIRKIVHVLPGKIIDASMSK